MRHPLAEFEQREENTNIQLTFNLTYRKIGMV